MQQNRLTAPEEQPLPAKARLRDWSWPFWPLVPLYPFGKRWTRRHEVVKDTIWTFEQIQGIFYVVTPIRMSVVKLRAGGLLIYAPVAPTPECIRLVKELVATHGDVQYILLPTVSGLEHKVFVGPFARHFPTAQVFVAPQQWSFPLNLPLSWLGFPPERTQVLPEDGSSPFGDEFDYAILGPIGLGLGPFAEVALFHRRSRTLLVTDTVISVPQVPPAIVERDPYPLLFHARDSAQDQVEDTAANRRRGWQRICLFTLYLRPSTLEILKWPPTFRQAWKAPDHSKKAYFGLFPFRWHPDWQQSFEALHRGGRLFVAPILQTLILNRAPKQTLAWADKVASWDFKQIVPCHFDAPISAEPTQFRQAFFFLEKFSGNHSQSLPEEDFELLKELEQKLNQTGITPPRKEKV